MEYKYAKSKIIMIKNKLCCKTQLLENTIPCFAIWTPERGVLSAGTECKLGCLFECFGKKGDINEACK